MKITDEQRAAIDSKGKTIVSASAGSGKTFVMIQKLVSAIEDGVDLDRVLAVTFTKKAASQMKEKLRAAIIERMAKAKGERRAALKAQLSKIATADISTIHAFCARLLRTYFYCVGIDGTFDIISADDAAAKEYKMRALDTVFERYYAEDNEDFLRLLKCFRKKRSDGALRFMILEAYEKLRITADYLKLLKDTKKLYTKTGFARVCKQYKQINAQKIESLKAAVEEFAAGFVNSKKQIYDKIFSEMLSALDQAEKSNIFSPLPPFTVTRKPTDSEADKASGEQFRAFKDSLAKSYNALRGDIADEQTELENFMESGRTAIAFANVLKDFDSEYTAVKRDENKLDYNDLEHLTLALLSDERVKQEINAKYSCVFVDEYQDVNPVQEEIISRVGADNVFLVGDVKQAIYGFRGSKSLFFAEKYNAFEGGGGSALRLSGNFRSSDGVINFVNAAFSQIMTVRSCGFDYASGSLMHRGGGYPDGFGSAEIHVFGKDEEERKELGVYSVRADAVKPKHTREGLAVLEIVERELKSKHYDLKSGEYVDTQAGDICILTRKRGNAEVAGIVRALTDAGYTVAGAQQQNICLLPEVRQMIDILEYIDNSEQDIPFTTALLSPVGGFTCNELATIRIAFKSVGRAPFRACCKMYSERIQDCISDKLQKFYRRTEYLRCLAEVLSAAEVIDKVCEATGLEAEYCAGSGEKLRNIRTLAKYAEGVSVTAFLSKLKDGGYEIIAPSAASSDSIKLMTMHASKGLEFPVVIIADICATFKGRDYCEMPFGDEFGFAPKRHDFENMLLKNTILRRLTLERQAAEELKNELNLFYVACTRAMCRLHVMAQDIKPYSTLSALDAKSYAELFDMSAFGVEEIQPHAEFDSAHIIRTLTGTPDEQLKQQISTRFMRRYAYSDSVNLPVKSSASAILKNNLEEPTQRINCLFEDETYGRTGAARGTAYHAYLQHCDFAVKDVDGIQKQIKSMVSSGKITEEQGGLLNAEELAEILSMPVFSELDGATLFREREFLCRMPANIALGADADDFVLIQGAIDLMAVRGGDIWVVDYKYSQKSDEQLIEKYSPQLALYKRAAQLITGTKSDNVKTVIVNIFRRSQIVLNLR